MGAGRELNLLAQRKAVVQARIAVHRLECVVAVAELLPTLRFVDRVHGVWRRLSPWVKALGVPLGILGVKQLLGRRSAGTTSGSGKGRMAALLGALPLVIQVLRALRTR